MRPLTPAALAERLAGMFVVIEVHSVETGSVAIEGYYRGQPRPTGQVSLTGGGHVGRGENVGWTPQDQVQFGAVCDVLVPRLGSYGQATIGEVSASLLASGAGPHHRAAIEAAAVELALRQASTDLFSLANRPQRHVRYCRSIGREALERDGPLTAVERVLEAERDARLKIDCPPAGWPDSTWRALAATGRIVIVDFKRGGPAGQVALAHRHLPEAWLEDPPASADGGSDPTGRPASWLARIALDGYVEAAADLDDPPLPPAAVNVKVPRVGGLLEALGCLERCAREGWRAYMGGMFEVGVGRRQARDLAALFTADAWNDLAPLNPA